MLWRIAAVASMVMFLVIMIAAVALMTVLYIASPGEHGGGTHIAGHVVHAATVMTAVSALPIIFCFIGNRSPGAADNASGVAAVLLAAEMLGSGHNVGVLLTSAEELGLAGARAFVRDEQATGVAINCDTVDDSGEFIFMSSGRKPQRLAEALDSAARRTGITSRGALEGARLRSMLPGVLADNIAFSDAGWESLTVSRGNLATLARVHTARDRAEIIEGTGIAQAARLIVATVEELS